jgi:hypothetical protein
LTEVRWTAAGGGAWGDAGSWSGGAVPGKDHHAVIDLDGTYTVTVDGDVRVGALTLGGGSGTVTLAVPNDALIFNGPGTVGPGAVLEIAGGRLGGDGDLVVDGRMVWSGGSMAGRGKTRIAAGGRLELVGGGRKVVSLRHLENAGSLVWRDRGILTLTFAAQIKNLEGGTFEMTGGARLDVYGPAGPAVENAGTLRVAAPGVTTFETPLTSSGTVQVGGGGLELLAGYTQTAGVTTLEGTRLAASELLIGGGELRGDGTLEGAVTNSGRIEVGAAGLGIAGDYLQTEAGELRLEVGGELRVSGQAILGGGLELVWPPGSELAGGALEVLTFAGREGDFARLEGLAAPTGETLEPRFTEGGLILGPPG